MIRDMAEFFRTQAEQEQRPKRSPKRYTVQQVREIERRRAKNKVARKQRVYNARRRRGK